jgi:hypothetical protein
MKRKSKSRKRKGVRARPPFLLIGWGQEGAKDVYAAREEFPCDQGLDCVDAQGADSEEVLEEIADWLKNNRNAQILYIGAHGNKGALAPTTKATPNISWPRLAEVLSSARKPIRVWFGACLSTFAAERWNDPALPVDAIISFSGNPKTFEVMELLRDLVKRYNVGDEETSQDEGDLSFLPEDIVELREAFPNITLHYKTRDHGYVNYDEFSEITGKGFSDYLDSKSNKILVRQLVHDVMTGLDSPDRAIERPKNEEESGQSPCDRLVVRKLNKKRTKAARRS